MTGPAALLGFDYGEKKIGIAVGHLATRTAMPLCTVPVKNLKPDWLQISELISQWRPGRLLVGLPLNMDGSEQAMTKSARRFSRQLEGRYQLPVDMVDERLSSIEARSRTGGKVQALDPVAAQIIIETWMEHAVTQRGTDGNGR